MENTQSFYKEKLQSVLGKVFVHHHSYREPEVVQVVGWTPNAEKINAKVRYVYVDYIELKSTYDQYGGESKINTSTILTIDKPVKSDFKLKINFNEREPYLSKGNSKYTDHLTFVLVDNLSDPGQSIKFCQY